MAEGMKSDARIFVAGHRGLVGSALVRAAGRLGYGNLLLRSRAELDLRDQAAVRTFFAAARPEYVILAAAKVGGILANSAYPADFLMENLAIQTNVLEAARESGVARLLFLGSASIYPRLAAQPMAETALLTGELEPTNRAYALAKIAGVEMCRAMNRQHGTRFLAAMPANLYGPGDKADLKASHVVPALIRKAVEARRSGAAKMEVWGTGKARRELLHADDLAEACFFLMNLDGARYSSLLSDARPPLVNVGSGEDVTIRELAELIARLAGFGGALEFDATKPDGAPRRLLDVSLLHGLGWRRQIGLEDGLRELIAEWPA